MRYFLSPSLELARSIGEKKLDTLIWLFCYLSDVIFTVLSKINNELPYRQIELLFVL